MTPLARLSSVRIVTPAGRALFDGLSLSVDRERVALVGRNGVGKSTLLAVLAGALEPVAGRALVDPSVCFVPQADLGDLGGVTASHGQVRRQALERARDSGARVLLLDEPTEGLDDDAVAWLRAWLRRWPGCLVVASHDRRLLSDFDQFFVLSEAGCRHHRGTLAGLDAVLDREHLAGERRYASRLARLSREEARTEQVARRKARKKRRGRCSELDRCTPRIRLNQKRDRAQDSHGRLATQREARLDRVRQWSRSARRALSVTLPLDLEPPSLPEERGAAPLVLRGVSAQSGGRRLFGPLHLEIGRTRLGVVGPNGAGKSTLLDVMTGHRAPAEGCVERDETRVRGIRQGGADWMLDASLIDLLDRDGVGASVADRARLLVAHRFPLALAERPLTSLSPGERIRAALLCLFERSPPLEVLVLDEPTSGLDLVGQRALTAALRAWPGGLVVASHDRAFLGAIGVDRLLELG